MYTYMYICRVSAGRPVRRDGYQPITIQDREEGVRVVSRRGQNRSGKQPSLVIALVRTFWGIFLAAAAFKFVNDLLAFVSPQILK